LVISGFVAAVPEGDKAPEQGAPGALRNYLKEGIRSVNQSGVVGPQVERRIIENTTQQR
jgi:hypothetical protein